MTKRALAHLKRATALPGDPIGSLIIERAAGVLWSDRDTAQRNRVSMPGQAELIDLVWALRTLKNDDDARSDLLAQLTQFAFDKHGKRSMEARTEGLDAL
ncbi:MAG: hypothetical protein AAF449_12385 [Myxococcota bacterium]